MTHLFVETLQNRTTRSRIELQLTQSIIDELVTRRRYTIVRSKAEADAILSGALTSFVVRPVQFGPDGRATEYEITIRADMELARTASDEILWGQSDYVFKGDYELELGETRFRLRGRYDRRCGTAIRPIPRHRSDGRILGNPFVRDRISKKRTRSGAVGLEALFAAS